MGYYRVGKTYDNHEFVPLQNQPKPENVKSRGLGDTIARITKMTGIDKIVDKMTGKKGCGCKKRQETLNKMFPYS
jgi:hypothetical protein